MFLLGPNTAGMRCLQSDAVAPAALTIASPAIACAAQHPRCALFACAFLHLAATSLPCVRVLEDMCPARRQALPIQKIRTEETTLFQPVCIEFADAYADVLPPYVPIPIPE